MYVYIIKKKKIYMYIYIFVNKKFFVKAVQIFDNDIWERVYFLFFALLNVLNVHCYYIIVYRCL